MNLIQKDAMTIPHGPNHCFYKLSRQIMLMLF